MLSGLNILVRARPMDDTERHVKKFVFGRLLPVRGVDHVWERRYGWHWVVENRVGFLDRRWVAHEWLKPDPFRHGYKTPPPP